MRSALIICASEVTVEPYASASCKDVGAGGGMPDAVLETGVPLTCAADVGCEQSVEYWTSTATGDWSPRAPHLSVVELRRYVEETKRAVLNASTVRTEVINVAL